MASLNLNQPADSMPSTFDAHASAVTGYKGIQMPANNQGDQVYDRNTDSNSPENNLHQNASGMPQGMYVASFDATGAYSTGAMGLNTMMMPNWGNSASGMDQGTSMTTDQTFQQIFLYQQQQQYMMAMASSINTFGGFPGAYCNMEALYGEAGWGHHNIMNNMALHNFSTGDSQAGTDNANISMNLLHNMHHELLMQQQMTLLAQQTQAQHQHQQHQQQPYCGSNGASSRMSNMWVN